jgi:hypothetical protein
LKYIHYGHDHFDIDLFESIKNRNIFSKPYGGFWASGKHYDYPWSKWCKDENYTYKNQFLFFEFDLIKDAKILTINECKQLKKLPKNKETITIFKSEFNIRYLDFEKLSLKYDAIEVLISKDRDLYFSLYGWDCDSILIMNPKIIIGG